MAALKMDMEMTCDVLVLGGGPAGTWAAYTASSWGAKVVLADKGYCGSSGATAPSGTNLWNIHAEPEERKQQIGQFLKRGNALSDKGWLERLIQETAAGTHRLVQLGYPFPLDQAGKPIRRSLQGPEYMRLMRQVVQTAGVKILDHAPALHLLKDEEGVHGAHGIRLQTGGNWTVHARAVIIATGGCAFLSKALGTNVLTGDGYLMAAEAGAELSGMEFSNEYGLAAAFSTVTKNFFFLWASYSREDGTPIERPDKRTLARHLMEGPVFAILDQADARQQAAMRATQPNFFLPFDRLGINPFKQRFPIALRLEGTVRGNGGINLVNDRCAASVPGLFAAGDAATRELVTGGTTGGGNINASWAMTSGRVAGRAAAAHAAFMKQAGRQQKQLADAVQAAPDNGKPLDIEAATRALQGEVVPFEKNLFRTGTKLQQSLDKLDALRDQVMHAATPDREPRTLLRKHELLAMIATARWMYTSALGRPESRGMHQRDDFPDENEKMSSRLIVTGVENIQLHPSELTLPTGGVLT